MNLACRPVFQFAMILCVLAMSAVVGLCVGFYISTIGDGNDVVSLVVRGAVLILPLVGLAMFVNWRWLLAAVAYLFGFHSGYAFMDAFGDAVQGSIQRVTSALAAPYVWFTGREFPAGAPTVGSAFQNHPELFWYYDLAILLVSVVAILRHQCKLSAN